MSADNPPPHLKSPFLIGLWCSQYITDDTTEATGLANELSAAFHGILKWSFFAKEAGFLCPEKRLFVYRQAPPCNQYDSHGRLVGYNLVLFFGSVSKAKNRSTVWNSRFLVRAMRCNFSTPTTPNLKWMGKNYRTISSKLRGKQTAIPFLGGS